MRQQLGAKKLNNGKCRFRVWAPCAEKVELKQLPNETIVPLLPEERGYWQLETEASGEGLYWYVIDGKEMPDPASRSQPQDIFGPSQLVDDEQFQWQDQQWKGMPLKDMILYELHVGTFTPEGTFAGVQSKIPYLLELGINAIELMPLGQFSGNRNWGYDGVFPFAVQHTYGGPEALKQLVDACHQAGIAVVVDAIYNHFGPEGSCISQYGHYFTDKYSNPWGEAINFDDVHSDEVRNYFIQNALMWFRDYHIDALRLDAVHAYNDVSALHFLQELRVEVDALQKYTSRTHVLIGESNLNDPRYISPLEQGGYGLDGQWCDEFHHALHALVTGERNGYYADFGNLEEMRRAFESSFVYAGHYSEHRKRTFGAKAEQHPYWQFVIFSQNHDQIGNRLLGERISQLISYEGLKLVAGTMLVSPSIPMLFMGEEYGEEAPFLYFIDHKDEKLIRESSETRQKEFDAFHYEGKAPEPASEETFLRSKLRWDYAADEKKKALLAFYKHLIQLRKTHSAFQQHGRDTLKVTMDESNGLLKLERHFMDQQNGLYIAINFSEKATAFSLNVDGPWRLYLDSADRQWQGAGKVAPDLAKTGDTIAIQAHSLIIYLKA